MSSCDQPPRPVRRSPRRFGADQASSSAPGKIGAAAVVERFFLQGQAARGVAGAAMAEALHQIGAAIPGGVVAALGDIAAARGEQTSSRSPAASGS